MRTFAYGLIGFALLVALLFWGWWEMSKEHVKKYRESKIKEMQDSQRGRRPMWPADSVDSRKRDR